MSRRKRQSSKTSMKRRSKTVSASTTTTAELTTVPKITTTIYKSGGIKIHDPPNADAPSSSSTYWYHSSSSSLQCQVTAVTNQQQQVNEADGDTKTFNSCCYRRRRHRTINNNKTNCPSLLVMPPPPTTTSLPLAAYPPASLFMMLLVASVLPKNTFSLRWLALSGVGSNDHHHHPMMAAMRMGGSVGALHGNTRRSRRREKSGLMNRIIGQRKNLLFYWFELIDGGDNAAVDNMNDDSELPNSKVILSLWDDVVAAEERICGSTQSTTHGASVEDGGEYYQNWSILNTIPRGGGGGGDSVEVDDNDHSGKSYPGLVNLGNTCYLNAQLQCAYHIPYLRKLVLDAEDEVVREEIEVEVEVDDDEEGGNLTYENHRASNDEHVKNDDERISTSDERMDINNADRPIQSKAKSTTVRREIKERSVPISHALRALKVTFNSLHNNPSCSSGSTSILCRTLGINPYLQQDGQEFWKLFIPEIDNSKLAGLYSGYYEDYVREIVPENETIIDEEFVACNDYGEEKKDDADFEPVSITRKASTKKARERKRIEPFLDLSIPVAEGSSGSVEDALREMFTRPEILLVSEGNGWRPSKGNEKVDAYKGASLKSDGLPPLLQLHLKRFKYDYETEETSKINSRFSFPSELDLSQMSENDCDGDDTLRGDAIYDLQSIVVHKGEYGSGHYYSYVRPEIRTNDWYRFDDEFVTRVDWADVVADAYGGTSVSQQTRSIRVFLEPINSRPRRLFWPLLALFRLLRRAKMIGSNNAPTEGHRFGYGGKTSNAYMLQYVRRADIPMLYLEESNK